MVILKRKNKGIILIDSLISFLCVSASVSLLLSLYTIRVKEQEQRQNSFDTFNKLNEIYYEEGVYERYDDMFDLVLSC